MAEYPTRQFSASDAYTSYMKSLEDAEKKKKAYNIVHNMYKLTNPHYSGSSEESSNLSKISKLGSGTSSGMAARLRLMTAADKENLGVEFTKSFQDWFTENPNSTIAKFNTWANKQGPWYSVELRKQHAAEVQRQAKETSRISKEERDIKTHEDSQLKEEEKDAIQAAANALSNKYAGRYRSQGAGEQGQILAELQREIDDSELPSELKGSAFTETLKILKDAYGFKGDVKAEILAAEDKALQKSRAERKWNLGDRHPQQWWADTKASMVFRELMEETKEIETDFERAQKIQELKRIKLVQGQDAGINEDELDSLLASAGFPAQPFTSNQYNQLMERKQLIAGGRFEDAYQMYNREFSQDPAFMEWQENAREAGIYKIMSSLVPDWSENSRALTAEWEEFREAELLDDAGVQIEKAERDRKTLVKLDELASKYKVSPRFIYWALTKGRKDVWGIGATVLVDI
jgi:hypothetical protein